MKPEWFDRRMVECQGKDKLSAAQAREVAERMRQRDRNRRVSAYRCASCGDWHVGSAPPMLKSRGRREAGSPRKGL